MEYVLNTMGTSGIKFFKLSHNEGRDCRIIAASTRYEAEGFYLTEEAVNTTANQLDETIRLPIDYSAVFLKDGEFRSETLKEIYMDQDDWIFPKALANLKMSNQ